MLEIKGLGKTYGEGEGATRAIDDISFAIERHVLRWHRGARESALN